VSSRGRKLSSLKEELGIGKASADHVLVPLAHHIQVEVVAVAHRHKVGHQLAAVYVHHGEVTLVLLHHRDQHIPRQRQVLGLKATQEGQRELHKVRDLIQ